MPTAAARGALALPAVAEAAGRLTTTPAYLGDYHAHCRIAYFGQQTGVKVKMTLVGYATRAPEPVSRLFKLGPNNRAAQLSLRCDPAGGTQGCQDTRCVFDIQDPSEPPLSFLLRLRPGSPRRLPRPGRLPGGEVTGQPPDGRA